MRQAEGGVAKATPPSACSGVGLTSERLLTVATYYERLIERGPFAA